MEDTWTGFLEFLKTTWLCWALIVSAIWGARGVFLFTTDALEQQDKKTYSFRKNHPNWGKAAQAWYQFLFNFVGSFAGWVCLYVLAVRTSELLSNLHGFTWVDLVLFVFALLGLTGHLPQTIIGFVCAFSKLGEALAKKIT